LSPQNKNHCILSIDVDLVSSLKDVLRKLKTDSLFEWVSVDVLKCFSESRFVSLVKAVKEFHTAILSASSEGLRDFFGIAVRCVDSLTLLASTTDGRLPALTDVQLSDGFREITKCLVGVTGGAPELCTRFVLFVEKVVVRVYSVVSDKRGP
jgi:hypothetical protein